MSGLWRDAMSRNMYADGNTADRNFLAKGTWGLNNHVWWENREVGTTSRYLLSQWRRPMESVGGSFIILQHQRAQGRGMKLTNDISLSLLIPLALLYVDDGEILDSAQSVEECSERVVEQL